MKYISGIIIVLGVALALVALNLDVTVDNSEVSNLNLMAQRQNLLIIGCVIFLAGIIIWVNSIKNSVVRMPQESAAMPTSGKFNLKTLWQKCDSSTIFLTLSTLTIVIAVCIPWEITGVRLGGRFVAVSSQYLGFAKAFVVFVLWAYPFYTIIASENRIFKILIVNSIVSLLWVGWNIFKFLDWSMYIESEAGMVVNAGKGMFFAVVAVLLFLVGTFLARSSRSGESAVVNLT